ncbi:unnamed protein product, partial [Mesorhabditis spiculigera]
MPDGSLKNYNHELLKSGLVLKTDQGDRFKIGKPIAYGRFGDVYSVDGKPGGPTIAIRTELPDLPEEYAQMETIENILSLAQKERKAWKEHLPVLYGKGAKPLPFLVLEAYPLRLDEVISTIVSKNQALDRESVCFIGLHTLRAIQELHRLDYVHRDIRPAVFRFRNPKATPSGIILASLGFCKPKIKPGSGGKYKVNQIPPRTRASATTTKYWSMRMEEGADDYFYNDDLISWVFMFADLWSPGSLPWEMTNDQQQGDAEPNAAIAPTGKPSKERTMTIDVDKPTTQHGPDNRSGKHRRRRPPAERTEADSVRRALKTTEEPSEDAAVPARARFMSREIASEGRKKKNKHGSRAGSREATKEVKEKETTKESRKEKEKEIPTMTCEASNMKKI